MRKTLTENPRRPEMAPNLKSVDIVWVGFRLQNAASYGICVLPDDTTRSIVEHQLNEHHTTNSSVCDEQYVRES